MIFYSSLNHLISLKKTFIFYNSDLFLAQFFYKYCEYCRVTKQAYKDSTTQNNDVKQGERSGMESKK